MGKHLHPSWMNYSSVLVSDQNHSFLYFLSRNQTLHISQGSPQSCLLHEACPDCSNQKKSSPLRSPATLNLKLCVLSVLQMLTFPVTYQPPYPLQH